MEGKRPQVTTAVAPSTPLTAVDRCDRCGAQAYLRVELAGGGDLLFCAHHAREHGDKLREIAVSVHDGPTKLTDTPTVAPGDRALTAPSTDVPKPRAPCPGLRHSVWTTV
jgi:hypothetical protein